jgi:hypothetical protein
MLFLDGSTVLAEICRFTYRVSAVFTKGHSNQESVSREL